jgi:DnaK suppressor protein
MDKDNKAAGTISSETVAKIKKQLLQHREEVMKELQDFSKEDDHESDDRGAKFPEYGDKPDENAQEISEYTTTVATEKILEKSLEDIDKSLKRIENGTYGVCKYCGGPIGEKRLLARPTASSCISCKTELQEENE